MSPQDLATADASITKAAQQYGKSLHFRARFPAEVQNGQSGRDRTNDRFSRIGTRLWERN